MNHECLQDERIRNLTARMDKIEERVDTTKDDLKAIKAFQMKLMWAMVGAFASSTGTLFLMIFKMKGVG